MLIRTVLFRPNHWDQIETHDKTETDSDGYFTVTLVCGCKGYFKRVMKGPFSGLVYGDARYDLCNTHAINNGEDE